MAQLIGSTPKSFSTYGTGMLEADGLSMGRRLPTYGYPEVAECITRAMDGEESWGTLLDSY